jgi:hypothetical protein
MDPNETLSNIVESLDNGDYNDARDAAEILKSWLSRNGCPPIGCTKEETLAFCVKVLRNAAAVTLVETCIGE